jgi:hypothetical protein
MTVTLDTMEGPLLIGNAYLPPNVDSSTTVRDFASAQHEELHQRVLRHKLAIIGFDGNETITLRGRI